MWGNEMNLDVDAWEAGLGSFIRMKKKVGEEMHFITLLGVIYGLSRFMLEREVLRMPDDVEQCLIKERLIGTIVRPAILQNVW